MFADLIDQIINQYKINPINKVFIDEKTLLASAAEETGNTVTPNQLRSVVENFLSNNMDGDDYSIYDGAVYACSVAANHCFGDLVEYEEDDYYSVDYQLSWIHNSDGSFTAEISPC